jgi:hypothetical protein
MSFPYRRTARRRLPAVIPAQAGIQWPGLSFALHSLPVLRHPCLDSARSPCARVTFLSGKVTKATAPGMTVSPTSCRRNFPWCSPYGSRAELGHPWPQTCGACSAVRLRAAASCNGAKKSSTSIMAIHGLVRSKRPQPALFVPRAGSAPMEPLCRGEARTIRPAGWAQWIAPTCRRATEGASASPSGPNGLSGHGWPKSAAPGFAFSFARLRAKPLLTFILLTLRIDPLSLEEGMHTPDAGRKVVAT